MGKNMSPYLTKTSIKLINGFSKILWDLLIVLLQPIVSSLRGAKMMFLSESFFNYKGKFTNDFYSNNLGYEEVSNPLLSPIDQIRAGFWTDGIAHSAHSFEFTGYAGHTNFLQFPQLYFPLVDIYLPSHFQHFEDLVKFVQCVGFPNCLFFHLGDAAIFFENQGYQIFVLIFYLLLFLFHFLVE